MVEKVLKILNKEFGGLHQAAFLLGSFAILSQVLALLRDRLFAHYFGAGATLDVYYAAFRIPDLIYASIASLVSVTVLIPFIVKKLDGDLDMAKKFLDDIFSSFLVLIVLVSAIVFFLIPVISPIFFSGFSVQEQNSLVILTRILLLSPILLGVSNLLGSITQTFKKFFVYALSPVLYNAGIIFGVVFLYPVYGMIGLGFGVVIGAFSHLLIQIPVAVKQKLLPRFSVKVNINDVKDVVFLSLPRTLGLSANHIALLILISLASAMTEGSIAIFNLSFNLQSVPLSIIGVSYSVAAFPTLARLFSQKQMEKFMNKIITAARHILFWSMPVLVLFIVLRAQIVRTILGSGKFGWNDTMLAAASLALFSVSLIAQALVLLFVRGYYAAGNTKKPLLINVVSSVGIVIFAYLFIEVFKKVDVFRYFIESLLRVEDISGTVMLMLPLAYSIGMIINAVLLFILFKKDFGKHPAPLELTFRHSFYGSVTMGFVAYQFLQVFDNIFNLDTFFGIFMQGFLSGILGVAAGVALLVILRNKEISEIAHALHTKFWRVRPVAPEKEEL